MSPSASAPLGYLRAPSAWARLERASFLKKKKREKKRKLVNEKSEGTKTVKDLGLKSVIPFH